MTKEFQEILPPFLESVNGVGSRGWSLLITCWSAQNHEAAWNGGPTDKCLSLQLA